jgi:pyruvate-formate lyase-activating enzyme
LMRIVRMAGKDNVRARKAFMKLLCAGLSKNALLSSLQSIKKKRLPQSCWIDIMLTTMKANLRKKHAEFPYVTPEEAADAIRSLIAAGISTFVSCTLDPREKSGNMGKVWEFIFLGGEGPFVHQRHHRGPKVSRARMPSIKECSKAIRCDKKQACDCGIRIKVCPERTWVWNQD